MKYAVVHDRLCNRGGAEKVAIAIAEALEADIYTAKFENEKTYEVGQKVTETNPISFFGSNKIFMLVRMLDSISFAQLENLNDYDVVWMSGMWAHFAAYNNSKNIYYCHSPNRLIYNIAQASREKIGPFLKPLFLTWRSFWRSADKKAVSSVNKILCNSMNVSKRIKRFWNRQAKVVYPPVKLSNFYNGDVEDYWLSVNRITPEKRVNLQLDVFEKLPEERLIMVGAAEFESPYQKEIGKRIEEMRNVKWMSNLSDEKLRELYAHCKGTIQTAQDEDFGYIPPESFAAGKPCLAVNEGGFKESIENKKTGLLIKRPYLENFVKSIRDFDPDRFESSKIQNHSEKFSEERFREEIKKITRKVEKIA